MELKITNKTFGTVDYVEIGEYDVDYIITDVIKELGEKLEKVVLYGGEGSEDYVKKAQETHKRLRNSKGNRRIPEDFEKFCKIIPEIYFFSKFDIYADGKVYSGSGTRIHLGDMEIKKIVLKEKIK